MKKVFALLLIIAAAMLPVFANGTAEGGAGTVELVLSEVHAEGYPTTLADYEFARLVNERTEGRVNITVYSGGTLYGEETGSIEALQVGDLDFKHILAWTKIFSYIATEGHCPKSCHLYSVDANTGTLADIAQNELPIGI